MAEPNYVPLDKYQPPPHGIMDSTDCVELYYALTGRKIPSTTWRRYADRGQVPSPLPTSRRYKPVWDYEEVRDYLVKNPPTRLPPKKAAGVHGRRKVTPRKPEK